MRNKHVFGPTAKYIGGKLRMSNEMLAPLVLEALENTIAYVDEIVSRPENRNLTDVIIFGDFAEYQIAIDALHRKLKQRIHKPEDVETVILNGGLLFGRSPEIVTSRILRIAADNENGSDIWAEPKAGIDSQQVGLALEPEAAAIWCQHIQTDVKGELSKPGTQFMVVDVGGGTADISVQEKKPDGRLNEILRPDGGAWGETNVDKELFDWLGSIFGQKRIRQFRESEFGEHLDLLNEFEIKKRSIGNNNVVIRLPYSMRENSKKIKKSIDKLGLSEKVSLTKDKLKVDAEIAKRWFNATISNIASHISNLIQEQYFKEVRLVMVVGGFAECKLLQSAMIETLSNVRVIIPEEAGVAVLKGAVEFAQRPHVIASRVMKCSYGINKPVEYDAKVHDRSKVVIENGKK
ncbi:HS12A-like protein, partial [Mya arenaria]